MSGQKSIDMTRQGVEEAVGTKFLINIFDGQVKQYHAKGHTVREPKLRSQNEEQPENTALWASEGVNPE